MLPAAPVFLVQQTYRGRASLPQVGAARVTDRRTPPGLLLDFGALHLRGIREDATRRGDLAPLATTSAVYDCDAKQGVAMAAWVRRSAPSTRPQWDTAIREALAEQRRL